MKLTVDGVKTHYTVDGQGPDVLLLHGWGSSSDAFRLLTKQFCDRFRMIAVDFPGFGLSDMPPEPWNVADYVTFTLHFMQQLGLENPILVGHSFGGRVIIRMTGEGLARPPKIVLIDAAGVKPKKTFRQKVRGMSFKAVKWFLQLPSLRRHTQKLLEKARAHYGSADYNAAPPILRQTLVRVVNEDLTPYLSSIQAPTLLIYGEKDTATPISDARTMERLIPDAGLCIIRGAGHFSFVERPYEVHAILNSFLNGE